MTETATRAATTSKTTMFQRFCFMGSHRTTWPRSQQGVQEDTAIHGKRNSRLPADASQPACFRARRRRAVAFVASAARVTGRTGGRNVAGTMSSCLTPSRSAAHA